MITQTEESFYQKQDNEILKESSLVGKQAPRFQNFNMPCTSVYFSQEWPQQCPAQGRLPSMGCAPSCYPTMDFQGHTSLPTPGTHWQTHLTELHPLSCLHWDITSLNGPWNKSNPAEPVMEATISQLSHGRTISNFQHQGKELMKKSRDFCWTTLFLLELKNPQFTHFFLSHYFNKPQIFRVLHSCSPFVAFCQKFYFMEIKLNIHITY